MCIRSRSRQVVPTTGWMKHGQHLATRRTNGARNTRGSFRETTRRTMPVRIRNLTSNNIFRSFRRLFAFLLIFGPGRRFLHALSFLSSSFFFSRYLSFCTHKKFCKFLYILKMSLRFYERILTLYKIQKESFIIIKQSIYIPSYMNHPAS